MANITWNVINHDNGPCKVNVQCSSNTRFASEVEARTFAKILAQRVKETVELAEEHWTQAKNVIVIGEE